MTVTRIMTRPALTIALVMSLVLCGGAGPGAPAPHHAGGRGDGSIAVTSESAAYCMRLSQGLRVRMQTPHGIPFGAMQDVRRLYQTGTALCRGPHLRVGIERLRRALVLLNHSQDHS